MLANPFRAGDKVRYRAKDRRNGTVIWIACGLCSLCGFKNQEHCAELVQNKVCVKWDGEKRRHIYSFTDLDFEIEDEFVPLKPLEIKATASVPKGKIDHRKIADTVIDIPDFEEDTIIEEPASEEPEKIYTEDGAFSPAALASLATLELEALQEEAQKLLQEQEEREEQTEKAAKPKVYDSKSGDAAWITVRRRMEKPV